ncbi:MAG: VWA-like domain-containing protein [Lachnospiraceae bacterium]
MPEERNDLTIKEKLDMIGRSILVNARNELYLKMRFMDVALSSYHFAADAGIDTIGTDGLSVYYNPQYLGGLFREEPIQVNRVYLHLVLHGIFRHMIRKRGREERYYNLACDIAVESMIDGMRHACILKSQSWLRKECYKRIGKCMKVFTAEKIYGVLLSWNLDESEITKLEMEFGIDSHQYWPKDDDKKKTQIENKWQDVSERMETDMETFSKEASSQSGNFIDQLKVENRDRFDYKQFLRKFSVLKEEMMIDADTFDYVFYSYGLCLYGNMPLIEPQEWKETQKVEEFVIVIDTSMSCSGELVKKFLEQTYSVLSENESFFRKVNIHIIQCDDRVQEDKKITNEQELTEYMEHLDLIGEGGTDFRPAFEYVEKLRREHAFSHLRGLLYFTDGKGIYPRKMPDFEAAFVFLKEDYEDVDVPAWAIKLILEEEDLS